MTPWLWLKLVHVLAGTFWLGATAVLALYVAASARVVGPAAGPLMKHMITVRKLPLARLQGELQRHGVVTMALLALALVGMALSHPI